MGSAHSVTDYFCYERRKSYILKHGTWGLLGRECVCGSLADGCGFPSWGLYVASGQRYELNQVSVLESSVYSKHLDYVRELHYKFNALGPELGEPDAVTFEEHDQRSFRLQQFPHALSASAVWVPKNCSILFGAAAESALGQPRMLQFTDDSRSMSQKSGFSAKVGVGKTSAEASVTADAASVRTAGTSTVTFDIVMPMAKLSLQERPDTNKRYIKDVILGCTLKLKGSYELRGDEQESSSKAASASWNPFSLFAGSVNSQLAKALAPNTSNWSVIEQKGLALTNAPSAGKPDKMREFVKSVLLEAEASPFHWDVLFYR